MALADILENLRKRAGFTYTDEKSHSIPEYTVTMLGDSRSGKSVYMHALFDFFVRTNADNHFIRGIGADYQEQMRANNDIEKLTWASTIQENSGELTLPSGSTGTEEWRFQLNYGNVPICRFNWVDYRGGGLTELANSEGDAGQLRELIYRSHALLLFIDSPQLFYYPDPTSRIEHSGIELLTNILDDIALHANDPDATSAFSDIRLDKNSKDTHIAIAVVLNKVDSSLLNSGVIKKPTKVVGFNRGPLEYGPLYTRFFEDAESLVTVLRNNKQGNFANGGNYYWHTAFMPVGAFGHDNTEETIDSQDDSDDAPPSHYTPNDEGKELMHEANALRVFLDPYYRPTITTTYKHNYVLPPVFPSPINVEAPIIWCLDRLLDNTPGPRVRLYREARDSGILGMIRGQRWQRPQDTRPQKKSTTGEAIRKTNILPLSRITYEAL